MTAKISVILPVYNASDFLGQCLDSILMQTLEDIEVICVDDGSTDDSLQTLQGYGFLDSRLKVLSQEQKGLAAARNKGLKEATGEYVIFLEADEFFEPNMLEKMLARIEWDESDMVVCGHYLFDTKKNSVSEVVKLSKKYLDKPFYEPADLTDNLFAFCQPVIWNRLIRRKIITENKLQFDETVSTSELIFTSLVSAYSEEISMMKEAFVYVRTDTQKTQNDFTDELQSLTHLYSELKERDLLDIYLMDYLLRVRRSIQMGLVYLPFDQRRQALCSIRKILPAGVFEKLFSSTTPQISVIIPVYNTAGYLPECLTSVLNQTLQNLEIICVDDGSTDNSLEILNQFAQKDKRIKVIHQENQGQAVARNTAMEVATGTYIQFLDSDDYLEPDACECIYLYMRCYGAEMCSFAAIEFDQTTGQEFEKDYHCLRWLNENIPLVFDWQNVQNIIPHMAVSAALTCYNRTFLLRHGIEWIKKKLFYEDTLFFVESFLQAKRVVALPDKFYHRRIHENATTKQMATNFKDFIKISKITLEKIKKILPDENVFLIYASTFLTKAWNNFASLDEKAKSNQAKHMYNFCTHLMKKYRLSITFPVCTQWCQTYLKTKRTWIDRLKYQLYQLWVKTNRSSYTINLIQYINKPNKCLKILGIPVFNVEYADVPVKVSEQPVHQDVEKITNVYCKIFGLTFLKIEIKDLYE